MSGKASKRLTASKTNPHGLVANKKSFGAKVRENYVLFLMCLPALVFLLVNNYLPMVGLIIPFKRWNFKLGMFNSPWVEPWYKNFEFLFRTPDWVNIIRNTLYYNAMFIVTGTVLAILVAVFLSEVRSRKRMKFFQSTLLFPSFISWIIIGYLVSAYFHSERGIYNSFLAPLMDMPKTDIYHNGPAWFTFLPLLNLWRNVGATSLIYFGTILSIDSSLYEAAVIDGASKWKQFKNITLPHLMPVCVIQVLLSLGRVFYSDFGLFKYVPGPGGFILDYTQTIEVYVYNALMNLNNVSLAAATGLMQSIIGFVLVLTTNLIVRKKNPDYTIF